ncbi:MAG: pilus assembly protein PilP [Polyangiaceae bacterium]|nr:pilus assembly protein PilP [Polyangiaceae bacterium]
MVLVATVPLVVAACDEPQKADPLFSGGVKSTGTTGAAAASASASASASGSAPALPPQEFTEADFTETDKSRDPFRSFAKTFLQQGKVRVTVQRVVLAERYALDELKPVGIVSRGDIKALLTDPTGLGWIVKIGDYVGKAELVHTGGPTGSDVAINWRVDRIRENDIVLVREDPSHPEIPPSTRVILLYPTDQTPGLPGGPPPVTKP